MFMALAQIVNFGPDFATILTFIYLLNTEEVHHFRASNIFTVFAFTSIICIYTRQFQCKGHTDFFLYSDLPKDTFMKPFNKMEFMLCWRQLIQTTDANRCYWCPRDRLLLNRLLRNLFPQVQDSSIMLQDIQGKVNRH